MFDVHAASEHERDLRNREKCLEYLPDALLPRPGQVHR